LTASDRVMNFCGGLKKNRRSLPACGIIYP
jgi:hypothetical protein